MTEEFDPLDSSAQEAADAKEAEAKRLQREQEVDDFKWLMAHKQGRRVMWRLLSMAHLFQNSYEFGAQPGDIAFRCGEQNIGHQLMTEIHLLCPEQYTVMTREQQNDAKRRNNR